MTLVFPTLQPIQILKLTIDIRNFLMHLDARRHLPVIPRKQLAFGKMIKVIANYLIKQVPHRLKLL